MKIQKQIKNLLLITCGLLAMNVFFFGAQEFIEFDSEHWQLGPATRVEEFLGRKALTLTGTAFLKDVALENGVVEFDLACKEGRFFPGIVFRRQDAANYEEFYIRPHKSGQPDALQYTPVFNGLSAWQLYYGDGFTNTWNLPKNDWIHIKIEFSGEQARVFVGDSENPALVIQNLKLDPQKGGLGLKVTGPPGLAYFSHFTFREDNSLFFEPPLKTETPLGMITQWELSQSFPYNLIDGKTYPSQDILEKVSWEKVTSETSGLVNVSRYVKKGPVLPGYVMARTTISTDEQKTMEVQFGYSDLVSIFCNGRLIFYGNSQFRLRDPFFQGYVGLFDAVFLPLEKGENELLLLLAEATGGWGFLCKDGNAVYVDQSLEKAWELPNFFSWPETVLYDKNRDVLYISNLYADGMPFLSKVKPNGEIENLKWIAGLVQPTGMAIHKDKLFVVERAHIAEIDIPAGKIVKKHAAPSPGFLNDIAVDEAGCLYISDSQKGQILKFENGAFSTWKSGNNYAQVNGLQYAHGKLYAGFSSDSSLRSIDVESGEMKTLTVLDPGAIVDGIETDEKGHILVSDYRGKIFAVNQQGQKKLLLDRTAPKQYCANFAYLPEKNLLIVPSLSDNRITAYKLSVK
ncbi:MAG: hypothetical protein JXB26_16495 [Candidatus Aminicenantes bacterium]|nr:hypothetical protein [Candidatus Aminicenantes bacterium]